MNSTFRSARSLLEPIRGKMRPHVVQYGTEQRFPFNGFLLTSREFCKTNKMGFARELRQNRLRSGDNFAVLSFAHQLLQVIQFALNALGSREFFLLSLRQGAKL